MTAPQLSYCYYCNRMPWPHAPDWGAARMLSMAKTAGAAGACAAKNVSLYARAVWWLHGSCLHGCGAVVLCWNGRARNCNSKRISMLHAACLEFNPGDALRNSFRIQHCQGLHAVLCASRKAAVDGPTAHCCAYDGANGRITCKSPRCSLLC